MRCQAVTGVIVRGECSVHIPVSEPSRKERPNEGPQVPSVAEEQAGRSGRAPSWQGLRDQQEGAALQGPPGLSLI